LKGEIQMNLSRSGPVSTDNKCLQVSDGLVVTLGEGNGFNNRRWFFSIFKTIVKTFIEKNKKENKQRVLTPKGGVIVYKLDSSLVLIQNFVGFVLRMQTDPVNNSFILIFSRFMDFDCIFLNGEMKDIVPGSTIKILGTSDMFR